jgi:hypothetical protein
LQILTRHLYHARFGKNYYAQISHFCLAGGFIGKHTSNSSRCVSEEIMSSQCELLPHYRAPLCSFRETFFPIKIASGGKRDFNEIISWLIASVREGVIFKEKKLN